MKHLLFTLAAALLLVPVCGCSRAVDPDSGSNVTEISSISEKTSSGDVPPVEQDERKKESTERLSEPDKSSGISGASSAPPNSQNYEPSAPSVQSPPPQNQKVSVIPQTSSQSFASDKTQTPSISASSTYTEDETTIFSDIIREIVFSDTVDSEWPNELDVTILLKDPQSVYLFDEQNYELLHYVNTEDEEWLAQEPQRQEAMQKITELRMEYTEQVIAEVLKDFFPLDTEMGESCSPPDPERKASFRLMMTPEQIRMIYDSGVVQTMILTAENDENPTS